MLNYLLNLWEVIKRRNSTTTLSSDPVSGGRSLSWLKWKLLLQKPRGWRDLGDGQAFHRRIGLFPVPPRLQKFSLFTHHTWFRSELAELHPPEKAIPLI